MNGNSYNPQTVTHPGLILEETLEEKGIGSKEFAIRTGKPEKTISGILNEKSNITPEMAVLFEQVLKVPARFWLECQRRYDEFQARLKFQEGIQDKKSIEWAKSFPYNDLAKYGWVKKTRKIEEKVQELLAFFGVGSYKAWYKYYFEDSLKVAFRAILKDNDLASGLTAWLRHGQIQARSIEAPKYNSKKLKENLEKIKLLVVNQPNDFFVQLQKVCLEAGIVVVYSPSLPNIKIHGATRWDDDKPIIQLTGRYKRNDIFWFTFFHEVGHILKHGKKYISLENIEFDGVNKIYEEEADEFAADMLFPAKAEKELLKNAPITKNLVEEFAKRYETHPSIIVGRLHHKHILAYSEMREYFISINLGEN